MKIHGINPYQNFYGINNETRNLSDSVTDLDDAIDFINKYKNNSNEQEKYHPSRTTHTSRKVRAKHPQVKRKIINIKDITIEKLRHINKESSTAELIDFHTGKSSRNRLLPFIYIFRNRGDLFSINTYIKESMPILEKFPQIIEEILTTRDTKSNLIPSLFLSKDIWNELMAKFFNGNNVKKDILKLELETHKDLYPKSAYQIFNETDRTEEIDKNSNKTTKKKTDENNFSLKNLYKYISNEESRGNMFWHGIPYQNTKEPFLFTLLDEISKENDSNYIDAILKKMEQNPLINYNIKDSNGTTFFEKILLSQNNKLLDFIKDKKINYNSNFDNIIKQINDDYFLSKIKECNIYFANLCKIIKEKSLPKSEEALSSLNTVFFTREKSGLYLLKSLISTNDNDYILNLWHKYTDLFPTKSGKVISEFISRI